VSVERAIGNISLLSNCIPTLEREKLSYVGLASVKDPAAKETLYMLAALVFDLQRKMLYLFEATKPYATLADPALARRMQADLDAIASANRRRDYEALAKQLEKMMLAASKEMNDRYHQTLHWLTEQR
jgi:hypothetical protein